MGWAEYIHTPPVSIDFFGNMVGVKLFKVWDYPYDIVALTPGSILNDAQQPLPSKGDSWGVGGMEALRLDSYSVRQDGAVIIALAYYSTTGQLCRTEMSFQTEATTIPVAEKFAALAYIAGSSQAQGLSQAFQYWRVREYAIPMSVARKRFHTYFNLPATNLTADQVTDLIASETNVLHYFGPTSGSPPPGSGGLDPGGGSEPGSSDFTGQWMRFEGGDAVQISPDWFQVTYSWIYESGVLWSNATLAGLGGIPGKLMFPPPRTSIVYGSGAIWLVPPFERVIMQPIIGEFARNEPPPDPRWYSFTPYYRDARGWIRLPGMQ